MSWSFSPGLVAAFLEASCSGTEPCAPSNMTLTPDQFYWPDKPTEHSRISRFGMTCEPLTDIRGEDLLTWYREDFRAKTSAQQDLVPDWTAKGQGYGEKWRGLWAKYDPITCSLKTAQCSLVEDLTESYLTLPRSGLMLDGECYQLPMLARPTSENESGFLPTPSGTSNHGANHVMGRLDEWGGSSNRWRGTEIGKVRCVSFEEWMMGWPTGHSGLTPLETARFREFVQQHGDCSEAPE